MNIIGATVKYIVLEGEDQGIILDKCIQSGNTYYLVLRKKGELKLIAATHLIEVVDFDIPYSDSK